MLQIGILVIWAFKYVGGQVGNQKTSVGRRRCVLALFGEIGISAAFTEEPLAGTDRATVLAAKLLNRVEFENFPVPRSSTLKAPWIPIFSCAWAPTPAGDVPLAAAGLAVQEENRVARSPI